MLTIGKLAKASNVNTDTLRYYERQKLLLPVSRSSAGYRIYEQESIDRVRFIKKAQSLGFSLSEISQLLHFDGSREANAGDVLAITNKKIDQQHQKIKELKEIESVLQKLAAQCAGNGSTIGVGWGICSRVSGSGVVSVSSIAIAKLLLSGSIS